MDPQQAESAVIELVSTILERPVTRETSRDTESTWDSLKHMQIIFAFEDQFSKQLTEAQMAEVRSVAALIDLAAS